MAQAATATTDDLLSQLASSEIDRLLAEADGNPAPPAKKTSKTPAANSEPIANGSERAALLQAAGFDSTTPAPTTAPAGPDTTAPIEDERAALLRAAGFESPATLDRPRMAETEAADGSKPSRLPFFLKPLLWINAPLDSYPDIVRQILGKVAIVTLLNALAVLAYVLFFKKH